MDESLIFLAICLVLLAGAFFALVGFVVSMRWLVQRMGSDVPRPVAGLEDRAATLALLGRLRQRPDPAQALDEAMAALRTTQPLSAILALPAPEPPPVRELPASAPPQAEPVAPATPAVATVNAPQGAPAALPTPATPRSPVPVGQPALAAPAPGRATVAAERWLALDNITLLLYLGAALVVIAVGVFVGSSWSAIGGVARWAIVTALALVFFVVGETFVRRSATLARAGETFRGVGLVLLPFTALAYDRFVLQGEATPLFWSGVGAALAAFYYALYRWSSPGRLTAYLASLSAGIWALLLPDVLGLDPAWRAPALLALAGALLAVAWRIEPDGRALLARLPKGGLAALAESHVIAAGVSFLASVSLLLSEDAYPTAWGELVYFTLLMVLLAAMSAWFRAAWLAGAAALASGLAAMQLVAVVEGGAPRLLVIWNALAVALFALAPRVERRLPGARASLTGVALWWSGAAFAVAALDGWSEPRGWVAATAAALVALLAATARRWQTELPLWAALPVLHVGIFELFRLVPSESPSALLPTMVWLFLAALWLALDRRAAPAWAAPFWGRAFVAEAAWISLFALLERPSAALAGVALTVGWVFWTLRRPRAEGAAFAIAQAVYAEVALARWLPLPPDALPFVTLALGAALVGVAGRLAAPLRRTVDVAGQLLVLLAPLTLLLGEPLGLPETRWLTLTVAGQVSLALAAAFYVVLAIRRRSESLAAPATALVYALLAWLTLDHLPAIAAPFVALAVAVGTLALAPRAPGRSRTWMEPLAFMVALGAPLAGGVALVLGAAEATLAGLGLEPLSQLALFLSAALFAFRGWLRRERALGAVSGFLVYGLYAWLASANGVTALQAYSVPLAALLLALGWLFPAQRGAWEAASAFALLVPAGLQSLARPELLYALLLLGWSLAMLALGISLARRVPLAAGATALLLSALRQLWTLAATLPPGVTIGGVGLLLMVGAVLLLWQRDALLRLRERGGAFWEGLGRDEGV